MKLWMRKIAVVLITIMTLGMYTPPALLTTDAEENKEFTNADEGLTNGALKTEAVEEIDEELMSPEPLDEDYFIRTMTEQAKEQTLTKLGPRITNQVEDEFYSMILPKMEEVLETILGEAGEDALAYYGITEQPAAGDGERIFNIYDYSTQKDVAKFHVRRDNRPLEGYWFNFHYHLNDDKFAKHHEIGEIYWDKNMPPKWMA
ncbi:YpjP family protein [Virgibacillus sp. NKC19-16]|uniref:YpjP family protein n=1 Tax=Virgibacillus salidurans TaxID=2831673 RepID=UPI001F24A4C0|nr:YpjP family protein [Virgibacillus sp. NKC19-16]UJL46313.1 YpjP family protein [Virgibacillus sp. NKC19-16]